MTLFVTESLTKRAAEEVRDFSVSLAKHGAAIEGVTAEQSRIIKMDLACLSSRDTVRINGTGMTSTLGIPRSSFFWRFSTRLWQSTVRRCFLTMSLSNSGYEPVS